MAENYSEIVKTPIGAIDFYYLVDCKWTLLAFLFAAWFTK